MSLINFDSTKTTVLMRTMWAALGAFISVAAPFYMANKSDMGRGDAIEEAILWGLCAVFGVSAIRGGVEGVADMNRNAQNDSRPGDPGVADA
jgi:hypothetical protein